MALFKKKVNTYNSVAVKPTAADRGFNIFIDVLMVVMLIIIAIPLWSTITLSFRPNTFIGSSLTGMFLPPWKWSLDAYNALFGNNGFLMAFSNSLKIMVMGVALALFLTIPLAYGLSVKGLRGLKFINFFVLIPYVFNVGIIPVYILIARLRLVDHLCSVFLPACIGTYNVFVMRSFFEGIPSDLREAASIDGCTETRILFKIILPLSKAIILTVGLYYAVSYWNDYFRPMLYLQKDSLRPLPILLRNILLGASMNEFVEASAFGSAPIEAIKAASVLLSAVPMIIAYPFIQKYFTKGTLAGSVKG